MARHREPGTPPRPVVVLAGLGLAGVTGVAVWFLPAQATPEWSAPLSAAGPALSTASPSPTPAPSAPGPSGYVAFVDTVQNPGFDLPETARRTGVRWFSLGRVMAGPSGCAPKWGGTLDPGRNAVANRMSGLRAAGGDAGLAFGGPVGRDLASACADQRALTSAYRKMIGAFGISFAEFEVRDGGDLPAVRRRARALADLQRDTELAVTFSVPLGPAGLAPADVEMLRQTRAAGAKLHTINLLAAIEPHTAGEGRMRRLAAAVRAAHGQLTEVFGIDAATAWRRIALTAVLAGPQDLSLLDARKLSWYATRNDLAWLSTRGATPPAEVSKALRGERA
ncbi:hypothetical protein ACFXJ8_24650 [Nonomuraea sp. NPDC059194]|uniref:hypothetical protein n=1 Tax=Nonomuraea sp. NPDC059194 TaxID=3346764 RepID=UPI00367A427C